MKAVTKKLANKSMNDQVFALRRKVIALVYEAKKLYPRLPRVTVRVAENHESILGVGTIGTIGGKCVIWITEDFVAARSVVFHEILHAAFAQRLAPKIDPALPVATCNKLFVKYATLGGAL